MIMPVMFLLLIGLTEFFPGCKSDRIDEDLTNYKKPIVRRINPEGIIYNRMGFVLRVFSDYYENDNYVLYLNKRKFNSTTPNYWHYELSWEIPADFLSELANASGTNDFTVEVRITPIQTDISNNFSRYAGYISDVKVLQIKRNHTNFTTPARLFPLWENSTDPVLRIDGTGNLYLAWREQVNNIFQAFFCFSEDEGNTWTQVLNISRSSDNVSRVDMEIDGAGHFYMAWSEELNEFSEVYFSRSLDSGISWWNPHKLSLENENSKNPAIDVDARGNVFVAWTNFLPGGTIPEYDMLRLAASSDWGNSWQNRVLVENGLVGGEPVLQAGENGNIYLICGVVNDGLYIFYSSDYGNNWFVNQANLDLNFWVAKKPSLRIGQGDKLFLSWNIPPSGGHNNDNWIHFISGMNKGSDWNERQYIDHVCDTNGAKAAMALNGTQVNMLLHSGQSLFLIRSADEGATWSYPEFIPGTASSNGAVPLDMVTGDSGRIYLVYIQEKDSSLGTGSIYFMHSQ